MAAPALDLNGITVTFGGIHALCGVDLTLQPGQIHALIGPNGAGKTTLVSVLSGELTPDHGTVHLAGENISDLKPYQRARRGLLRTYQLTALFQHIPLKQNILLSLEARDRARLSLGDLLRFGVAKRYEAEIAEVLADFKLTDKADVVPASLSHGDRRRLELAMAIIANPGVLLLDEPLAGLSIADAAALIEMIQTRLRGKTPILLIEHDMDAVFSLADVITVMVNGNVLMTGSPEDVRNSEEVQAAYLSDEDDF
ncbi:ABC transporter ATP-binding protein [Rhodobacteraceae bacterium KMM 6894]|nr:ABC transporter ATP-binding protein [Rhodobacteraceae bacterium KMM 6894]